MLRQGRPQPPAKPATPPYQPTGGLFIRVVYSASAESNCSRRFMRPPREIPYEIPQRCPYRPCCNPETRKQNPLLTTNTLGTVQMGAKNNHDEPHMLSSLTLEGPPAGLIRLWGDQSMQSPAWERRSQWQKVTASRLPCLIGGYSKAHLAMEFNREPPPCMNDGKKRGRSQCGCGW